MRNQGFMFEHKAHMSPWPPTIYYRGGLPLNCSFVRLPLLLESRRAAWDGDILNSAQRNPLAKARSAVFSHPRTLAAAARRTGSESVCRPRPLRLLCLVSVATESERMQHPDARSGGIPPLTQGRGKRHIADGALARCRICWESEDGPRIGRPQSSLLFGQLFGGLCQKCAKCCLCLKRLRFLSL